jgi:type I restriction enzyme S subunit
MMATLGSFCEFKYGRSLPQKARRGGEFPVYGSNGVIGFHEKPLTSGPTIIIGRKGSVGALQYSDKSCCPIDTTYYVDRSCTRVDLRWLFYMLQKLGLDALNKHVAIPGLDRNDAYEKELMVPLLDDQKRIAAVLDKADTLGRKRKESLELTEKLVQSVFIDMFVQNPAIKDWKPRTIEWMAKKAKGAIRTGPFGSQLLHSEFVDHGVAVLGIDNAVKNRFEWVQPRFISPAKYEGLRRYKVFPGDLIITIMGTLGRCAIVPDDIPEAINSKHLCCITLDQQKCIPEFLHACLLNHPDLLRQLGVRTKGAVMPGLNMGIIKELELPLPPLDLQGQFKRVTTVSTAVRIDFEESQDNMENLFSALQQRAFRGELDLSRLALDSAGDAPIASEVQKPATQAPKPEAGAIFLVAPHASEATLKKLDAIVSKGEPIPWSADYFKYRILGAQSAPFSFGEVMQKAEAVFDEPQYDEIKDMILELLGKGGGRAYLNQRFDIRVDADAKEVSGRKEIVFEPTP